MSLTNINKSSIAGVLNRTFDMKDVAGAYILIPDFQRPYCWSAEDIRILLNDVDELRYENDQKGYLGPNNEVDPYYFGTVCFKREKRDSGAFVLELLDGQQRLTSILMLTLLLYRRAARHADEDIHSFCAFVDNLLGDGWQESIVVKQPQTIRQIRKVALELDLDYEMVEVEATASSPSSTASKFYADTLRHDCRRMRFILEHGMVAVSFLETAREASQFFQGENNRGLAMSLLDLLKAYHLRFETEPKAIDRIQAIWSVFMPPEEEEDGETNSTASAENHSSTTQRRALRIVEDIVIPLLLLRFGVYPLSANDPRNVDHLKGVLGTPKGDLLADEKIKLLTAQKAEEELEYKLPPADLLTPMPPGLPFFEAIDQYRRFADAVAQFAGNKFSYFKNSSKIAYWMLIAWVDRYLPQKLSRQSAEVIKDALESDPEFRAYSRVILMFLKLMKQLKYHDEKGQEITLGVYDRVEFESILRLMQYESVSKSLFFLPHHTKSPAACRLELQRRLRPENIKNFNIKNFKWPALLYKKAYESREIIMKSNA